jgi:hypothetical protein
MSSYTNSRPEYKTISERVNTTFDVLEDIITTFKKEGCPNCISLLSDVVRKHNHQEGGPSTDSNRLTEVVDNAKIGREIIKR